MTDEKLREAEYRIKAGATEDDLAAWLQMPVKRVKKLLRAELSSSAADAKHEILSKIYEAATSGNNLAATIFSAKARYGWRDTGSRETAPLPAALTRKPIVNYDLEAPADAGAANQAAKYVGIAC